MIIVDEALKERAEQGRPVRVGMVGAGFMAQGIALQIAAFTEGMQLVAIANRTLERAAYAYRQAGSGEPIVVEDEDGLARAAQEDKPAIAADPLLLARSVAIDVLVEVTGAVEHSARVVTEAIAAGKHVVAMNAELDGTVGPLLKRKADEAGVVFTNADGDQPGVEVNLYRFVKGMGIRPVLCGNIKGLHDPYRNPTTQQAFAERWGQNPMMVTSFADGTKISFEQAIVANATGMRVARRGMFGPTVEPKTHVRDAMDAYPLDALLEGDGIVDYIVQAEPSPGVFVLGVQDHPLQQHYLNLYKAGEGPLYCFYNPYHLCHFEVPNTIARAALFGDAAVASLGGPLVDVLTAAKRDLASGETIDGLGGYMTYGLAENHENVVAENLLPIGLAEGCVLKRDVSMDSVLTYDDVDVPGDRLVDRLRAEQGELFVTVPAIRS